jgi:stage 0 sporulation regulatory protein
LLPLRKLQQEIANKRNEMVQLGMSKGLSHPETVKVSQELDELLNKLAKHK